MMAFVTWDNKRLAKFNSTASSEFLQFYDDAVESDIRERAAKPSHMTFAASSFRCDRRSWFRLRGVQPDSARNTDAVLEFTAEIGTACHRIIQTRLKQHLSINADAEWVDVQAYIDEHRGLFGSNYVCNRDDSGLETQVEVADPPIRFACDGIIRWKGRLYLLEIKSAEFSTWDKLIDAKDEHKDQAKLYATLLHLDGVLFLYIDRQYGSIKCFEMSVSSLDKSAVHDKIDYVLRMVESNLAPDPLPKGDRWCTSAMCPYYKKCREYGR